MCSRAIDKTVKVVSALTRTPCFRLSGSTKPLGCRPLKCPSIVSVSVGFESNIFFRYSCELP
jgi:hypothetical protein